MDPTPQPAPEQEEPRLPPVPRPTPIRFDSKSEYACGHLLEKYVTGFELRMAETVQVPVRDGKLIDFRIHGVFVEFHPINFHHEFQNRGALRDFVDTLRRIAPHHRDRIYNAVRDELAMKYYERRKALLPKDAELIVCETPTDFYRLVLKRFADNLPKEKQVIREFHDAIAAAW